MDKNFPNPNHFSLEAEMSETIIQISDSPLARAIRRAIEHAYHDDRGVTISLTLENGPGNEPIAIQAKALIRFSRENGLSGTVTPEGERPVSLLVELPKGNGQVLFHIGG